MGQKWKKLYQLYKDQEELLKRNFADEVAKLEADQETALMEQQTLMLRQGRILIMSYDCCCCCYLYCD